MTSEGNRGAGQIRAIIFDMDNTLFDFVAAKQHACREVAKYLGRDDWEALFRCFLDSPHGFESHENIRDYFDLCGLLEECGSTKNRVPDQSPDIPPEGDPIPRGNSPTPNAPAPPGEGRLPSACGGTFSWQVQSAGVSDPEAHPKVRDNLLADKSLYCNEAFSRCCAIYEAEKVRVLEPYPGVRETLSELKRRGLPLAIVTDAHNGNALARLRRVGLDSFFDHVISYDMTGAKKPAPDAFLLALRKLGTRPSETLLVGDSIRRDIAPAQALGMKTAYAKYGDRNVPGRDPPDCRPDFVLGDIQDLLGMV